MFPYLVCLVELSLQMVQQSHKKCLFYTFTFMYRYIVMKVILPGEDAGVECDAGE